MYIILAIIYQRFPYQMNRERKAKEEQPEIEMNCVCKCPKKVNV